eukprot:CAMPEP_0194450592 /NCGR_PEP_ID=MMETSP0176-20130528/130813_1 /TAXON_ID=216777 /ORGANISM="Proboscia alata, Strain PI-D3" /LENGTH=79 /DNA_ID=CAMNT_0039277901 /DNA_START=1137 /DNA_END=1372 /DNA_ORIENTATION=-
MKDLDAAERAARYEDTVAVEAIKHDGEFVVTGDSLDDGFGDDDEYWDDDLDLGNDNTQIRLQTADEIGRLEKCSHPPTL